MARTPRDLPHFDSEGPDKWTRNPVAHFPYLFAGAAIGILIFIAVVSVVTR